MFEYRAEIVKVIDGDTLKVKIDVGFRLTFTDNFRLIGIDTPEIRGVERPDGLISKQYVIDWLEKRTGKDLILKSSKHGKYRWLAELWCETDCLNRDLVADGYADKYDV